MKVDDWVRAGGGVQGCNYFSQSHPELVLKVYTNNIPKDYIENELVCSRALKECGFNCPEVYELLEYDGSYGIVSERIHNKKSFCKLASEKPGIVGELAERMASMALRLHSTSAEGTPFKSFLGRMQVLLDADAWIDDSMRERIQDAIDSIKPFHRNTLLHGDFHFGNIITNGSKDYFIDLGNLSCGHPDFDLSMFYMVSHYGSDQMCQYNYHLTVEQAFKFWTFFKKAYYGAEIPDEELFSEYRKYLLLRCLWIQYDTNNSDGSRVFMDMFSREDCPSFFCADSLTSDQMDK